MENTYLEAILTRLRIGGKTTPADQTLLMKHMLSKLTELEEKMDETEAIISRSRTGKAAKKKTTSS